MPSRYCARGCSIVPSATRCGAPTRSSAARRRRSPGNRGKQAGMASDPHDFLKRFSDALGRHDWPALEPMFTDDFTDEYPQSGEVIRGFKNVRAILENYPRLEEREL